MDMAPDEARALVELIRGDLVFLADKIRQAYEGRAWMALGYGSWRELCLQEFGGGVQLPRGKRREVVAELSAAGMSSRAIGATLGLGKSTVNDMQAGGRNRTPAEVVGLDGKRYTPPPPPRTRQQRPGASKWSRRVQNLSATVPMEDLTIDEVLELEGAAIFLRNYCAGELIRRGHHQ